MLKGIVDWIEPRGAFDPRVRMHRWLGGLAVSTLFVVVYMLLDRWNVRRFSDGLEPWVLATPLDHRIPALPWSVWAYLLYYPLVLTPLLPVRTWPQLREVLVSYLVVTSVAWLCFIVFPVQMVYPELECAGASCTTLIGLYRFDRGVNIFPSLHAAHSVLAACIFYQYRHRGWQLVLAGAVLVSIAAVLTRQHYVVDVPAGIILGATAWKLTKWVLGDGTH